MTTLHEFTRREVSLPERANTARLIILPAHLILINTAAAPGCNVDRLFMSLGHAVEFLGDRAFELLRP